MHFLSSLVIEKERHQIDEMRRNEKKSWFQNITGDILTTSSLEKHCGSTANSETKDYLSTKYQALPEEIADTIEEPADRSESVVEGTGNKVISSILHFEGNKNTAGSLKSEFQQETRRVLIDGEKQLQRDQDDIIIIPGAKHSFEAVGGELVEIVAGGLIDWLSEKIILGNEVIDLK